MKKSFFLVAVTLLFLPLVSFAVLPPDLIFNVGAQFFQFFSLIAVIVGGVVGSVLIFVRSQFYFLRRYLYPILGVLAVIVLISILFVFLTQKNNDAFNPYNNDGRTVLFPSNNAVLNKNGPVLDVPKDNHLYKNDDLLIYVDDAENPFYLEIDLTRKQKEDGSFLHYYYLDGTIDGADFSDYSTADRAGILPIAQGFLTLWDYTSYSDLSTRGELQGSVIVNGKELSFRVADLEGDFITKNTPDYTRYQSVGEASVTYGGRSFAAQALYEEIQSFDYSTLIFFLGSDEVKQDTHLFVLWDENGDFYKLDSSDVKTDTVYYPSHTWFIHKNNEGYLKKSFTSDITAIVDGGEESAWRITAPDFNNAEINVALVDYVGSVHGGTDIRALVRGTITTEEGTRGISGFTRIIR